MATQTLVFRLKRNFDFNIIWQNVIRCSEAITHILSRIQNPVKHPKMERFAKMQKQSSGGVL